MTDPRDAPPALISIIVPVFNEAATVAAVIRRLLEIDLPAPREIIVVNDGSRDGTREVLDGLAGTPLLTVIHADRNRGKGHAIRLGFARARGTVLAIQDADLELDPAQLAFLVDPILKGDSNVVYGSRFLAGRPPAPWVSIAANRALTSLTNFVYGSSLTDMETCYKIMRSDVARGLDLRADRFDIEPEITARLLVGGHDIHELPVSFTPRSRAAGKKIGWRDGLIAVRVLLERRPPGALLTRALLLLAAIAVVTAAAVSVSGGFEFRLFGTRVRAHDALVPWSAAAVCLALVAARGKTRLRAGVLWWWRCIERAAGPLAGAVAIAAAVVGWSWGAHVAGGSDSYCYLNLAEVLAAGHTRQVQPIAANLPWPDAGWAFVPAGHIPAPGTDAAIVAICPAGYPLLMAGARALGGRDAMFWIVPLMGGLAVWLTFVLGRQVAGPPAGLLAAVLIATSPVFLYQIVQPMSDVPTTALWLLAIVLAWRAAERTDVRAPMLAGAAAGAALVVRPNLVPLAAVVAVWIAAGRRDRLRSLVAFAIAAAPFMLLVMALQNAMYGGPLRSGYGDLALLFRLENIRPNLERYPVWLVQTETPLVLLALAAPWAVSERSRRTVWWLLAFVAATFACYLPYVVFDAWWYLRFLLPAVAAILVLTAGVLAGAISRVPQGWRALGFGLLAAALALTSIVIAARRQVFDLHSIESRYRDAGEYVAARLPPNAAVVTVHESGSVRFYSGRPTLVWAEIDPAFFDRALDYLRSRGHRPYLLFETWEEPAFRKRFEGKSAIGALEWPPIAEINREVRIYDPADAERYLRGASIRTEQVWTKPR